VQHINGLQVATRSAGAERQMHLAPSCHSS